MHPVDAVAPLALDMLILLGLLLLVIEAVSAVRRRLHPPQPPHAALRDLYERDRHPER